MMNFAVLRTVGHGVAANPTSKMRKLAAEEGWPLLEGFQLTGLSPRTGSLRKREE